MSFVLVSCFCTCWHICTHVVVGEWHWLPDRTCRNRENSPATRLNPPSGRRAPGFSWFSWSSGVSGCFCNCSRRSIRSPGDNGGGTRAWPAVLKRALPMAVATKCGSKGALNIVNSIGSVSIYPPLFHDPNTPIRLLSLSKIKRVPVRRCFHSIFHFRHSRIV